MSPLQQKIADKKALAAQDTPSEEPNVENYQEEEILPTIDEEEFNAAPAPLAVTIPEGGPITTPAEEINKHGIMANTSGSFIDPLHSQFSPAMPSAITPTGESLANVFLAVDRSRKGYQWSRGIIRPNVFGQYIARDLEEQQFLEAFVTKGIMEVSPTPQPF